jgi:hypothetical protein
MSGPMDITIQETLAVGYFVVTMSPPFQEAQEGKGDESGNESRKSRNMFTVSNWVLRFRIQHA